MGNLLQVFQLGAGRRILIFPITFRRTFAGQCRIREQNIDFGIIPERERKISPSGDFITEISESYPANESVVIQKGGREIPSRVAKYRKR